MSIDVKDIREGVVEGEQTMADTATGAVVSVVDAATHPVTAVRQTVRRLEERGRPVNRRAERQVSRTTSRAMDTTADVVSGNLAERLTLTGIRIARDRARRRDLFGDVIFRSLELVHRGLNGYVQEVGKFQNATEPPARYGERGSPARRSGAAAARRSARTRRGSTSRTRRASTTRSAARKSTTKTA